MLVMLCCVHLWLLTMMISFCPSIQNPKFCDFVDKQTGYKTKCMLTFPLVADKECLGVVMALNKIGADKFSPEDEAVRSHAYTSLFAAIGTDSQSGARTGSCFGDTGA